jgi:hypothetical protein
MIDYSKYFEQYLIDHGVGGRNVLSRFLGYVQTRNIPVKEWKKEFLTHEDLIIGDVKESTRYTYHNKVRHFINYVVYCESHKEEKKPSEFKGRSKIAQITGHQVNTGSRKKHTRIVSHWSEL